MRIGVYGLGYVGTVTAAAFASAGHDVIGVDVNRDKVGMIEGGSSPVIEPDVDELVRRAVGEGYLVATTDHAGVVESTDISLVCVGTPSKSNGSLDLDHVIAVCRQIGRGLAGREGYHVVVIRSTVLPGTTEQVVVPVLEEESGRRAGVDFGVCFNPEFLREGSSVRDFLEPPFTLLGVADERSAGVVAGIYGMVDAPLITASVRVAEMVKYVGNAYHALKVVFGNEVGNICKALGIDSHEVMDLFSRDTKLNISRAYLTPGFAFGGSCLPKDLRALTYQARRMDVPVPLLDSILPSNDLQVERALRMVLDTPHKKVGVLGMSFKAGTDDLRESPVVELVERLIGKGYDVRIYDRNVSLASLQGANRAFIESEIPHVASLMCPSAQEVVAFGDVIVVGNRDPEHKIALDVHESEKTVLDLVRISEDLPATSGYVGISW